MVPQEALDGSILYASPAYITYRAAKRNGWLDTSEKTVCPECGSEKLVKWNPIKGICPKCGKKMKETGVIIMAD